MNALSIIVIGAALATMIGAVGVLLNFRRQDKRRGVAEDAVAKAAQEYFARFQIRARTIGARLPDGSMVLMVETPPHKKLRFSYIIEPPIKNFIRVQTGVQLTRIFWRFPIPPKQTSAPEVQYADAATFRHDSAQTQSNARETAALPPLQMEAEVEMDDYFNHQSYHIEEVSWEDFSTISQEPDEANTADPKPVVTKE